jgi:hypothetical protein
MKNLLRITAVLSAAILMCLDGCGNSVARNREKRIDQFLACTSDSLGEKHHEEIRGLFRQFWARADQDQVFDEDIVLIENNLQRYINSGSISTDSLLYFMAQVGYYTYRKDPRYNVPEGIVDHPTLNPDAALIQFGTDSTGAGNIRMFYRVPSSDSTSDSTTLKPKTPGR